VIERLIQATAAFAPVAMMIAYAVIRTHGDWRNEALWIALFTGGAVILLAGGVELAAEPGLALLHLSPLAQAAIKASVLAGVLEEVSKFAVVLIALNHVDARRMRDVVMLSLAVALGFAAMESFFHLVGSANWGFSALVRAGTAVPGHALNGLAMGAFLSLARMSQRRRKLWLCLSLLVPIMLHAAYDFPLFARIAGQRQPWLAPLWPAVILMTAVGVTILTDRVMAAALRWDREHKLDAEIYGRLPLIAFGSGFIASGIAIALLVRQASDLPKAIGLGVGALFAFLPVFFGFDLVRLGVFRKSSRAKPISAAPPPP
jgi:protease PrsW